MRDPRTRVVERGRRHGLARQHRSGPANPPVPTSA